MWCIGIAFLLCWIPINAINLLSDFLLLLNMWVNDTCTNNSNIRGIPRIVANKIWWKSPSVPKESNLIFQIQKNFFWRHNLGAVTLLKIKFLGLFLVFWKPNGSIWRSLSAIALPWFVQVTLNKCISDLRVGGFCQSNCPNAEQLQQVKNKLWPNNRDWFVSTAFPKGSHPERKVQFFWTLFKRPLTPPPFFIWTFVLFCRGCFLKRVFAGSENLI